MGSLTFSLRLALPAVLAAAPALAQLPQLDATLKQFEQEDTFYGSVLVTRGGVTLFRTAYGFGDEAKTEKNSAATVYYAPWMNEPMLAALAEMAQDRGLLSLDAPIGTYLPAFKGRPAPRVRDLLSHASGFPVFRLNMLLDAQPGTLTLADLASGLAERPLLEEPGKRFVWMFNNDELAGLVLETVTGKPFPDLLSEWLLKPLGMDRTGLGLPAPRLAWGLRQAAFQKDLALWKGGYRCSEGMYSTLDDLERFFSALASGRLLSARANQDMRAPYVKDGTEDVCLGFNTTPSGQLHNGGDDESGCRAIFWYDPRHDLRILVLCNRWMDAEGRNLRKILVPAAYASLGLKE